MVLTPLLLAALPTFSDTPDFAREVRPLLSRRCFACHGPDDEHRGADLRLDIRETAVQARDDGAAIVPGAPGESLLMARIRSEGDDRMPPPETGHALTVDQVELLGQWIEAGAPYAKHWSFSPPERPELPRTATDWGEGPLDRFVLARLEAEGLAPSAPADRRTLLRRLSLDLIGLPPTPEELAAFLADESPGAYARQVDRLLASPSYGERWARVWLDLARYADSSGYGSDPLREIWRYRDWVIEALDTNLPYDEFTRLQLAGDMLPEPSTDDLLATAFHRNTMTNTEGGTDDEEFRVAAVKDRVNTTFQVWMGLTAGCAQCHNHKFDPISQREYYELFAFFNQTEDTDQNDDRPRLATPTREQGQELARIDAALAELAREMESESPERTAARGEWEEAVRGAWTPFAIDGVSGTEARYGERGEVTFAPGDGSPATYLLEGQVEADVRALRIEVLCDAEGRGPGATDHGNFVLNEIRVSAPTPTTGRSARRLRIELPGPDRILSLAEVEVFGEDGANLARSATPTQSSTDFGGEVQRAIDGTTDGRYEASSVTHTRTEADPWFELDLGAPSRVERIVVHNRIDGNLESRLEGAQLLLLDGEDQVCWSTTLVHPGASVTLLPGRDPARIGLNGARASFSQKDFGVAEAIDGNVAPDSGWAIAPRQGEDHWASFELVVPTGALERSGGRLRVELEQSYGSGHSLERLRIATTDRVEATSLSPSLQALLQSGAPTAEEEVALASAFREHAPIFEELRARREELAGERAAIDAPTTPILRELAPEDRRRTHLLVKGNFLTPGEEVTAAVPTAFHPWPEEASIDRLGLAEWLVSPDNPLTARVAVNRLWSRLFGVGLVETEEDFGSQGTPPTHPELLDWLAIEFMEGGWDQKALLRTVVTSATYRQDSRVTSSLRERDPRNRLYARGPRVRLEAEAVRDQALALSGLLADRRGGPSVYPPQPDGLWQAAFNGQRNWPTSEGEDRWRRGVYVFLRRTIPYPSLATFDAPSRELCTARRIRTNTPLQALVTLNDPVFVEAAQALARRIVLEGGDGLEERLAFGLELCTAQLPEASDVHDLARLFEATHQELDEDEARSLATVPLGELPEALRGGERELAAWSVVAGVLLNLDAVLVKD